MKEVIEILKNIENTGGTNAKQDILIANKNNELLKRVLVYAYSSYKVYGVGKKTLSGVETDEVVKRDGRFGSIFELLDFMVDNNLNNEIKEDIAIFLLDKEIDERVVYMRMLLKDLRLGMGVSSINKAIKGLVPEFKVMLAKKFEDRADKIKGELIVLSLKMDGIRLVAIKESDNIKFFTRQGKRMEGLVDIEEEFKGLPDGVYDGEVLKVNPDMLNSKELFQETRKETGKKGTKKDLEFHVFDYLSVSEFDNGESELGCIDRKSYISDIISDDLKWIKEVEVLEITDDHSQIKHWLDRAIADGNEGIMVNIASERYQCKRSNSLLKVKQFHTVDLEIVGFEEGTGRLKGTLGRLTVDYKGSECGVGSGFSDADRTEIWNNQDKYLGRVVEVNYFEETENAKDDGLSLRFPTFERVRSKGKEVSYN